MVPLARAVFIDFIVSLFVVQDEFARAVFIDFIVSLSVLQDGFASLLAACGLPLRENMVDAIVSQIDTVCYTPAAKQLS